MTNLLRISCICLGLFTLGASAVAAEDGPRNPAQSLAALAAADDLQVEQVLTEPIIAQPVFLNFDERGRMWVVQYRQYPHPAGLKMTSRDNYWRAVYDKVPPPPPRHSRGADRISIHEDTDGDGRLDHHKVFVDGLNIVTAVARGRGGVWVLNPPYLLFYADADQDDVPDGDPEVVLQGFGLEDTHSVVNSLQWGPDGWLYAAQGSTVSGHVKRPGSDDPPIHTMGQLIWRYHPESRRYEIFAQGGGNAFGVEIDAVGRIYSGHNGGNTRGFHYVQGGYYQKGFSKHGPLSNPYAFGYFPAMRHHDVERFTHTFVIYQGATLPDRYHGQLLGAAPLHSHVITADVLAHGSTFQTKDVGHAVQSSDPWFRPVDIKVGPDGAVYVADWYDGQVNHYQNHEGEIDTAHGRIYRLRAKGVAPSGPVDLSKLTSSQLVETLNHNNKWRRRTALRLLADRGDRSVIPRLKQMIAEETGQTALEALWAVNLCGGFDDKLAAETLAHGNPFVRAWSVRLLGDDGEVSRSLAGALVETALTEPHVEVRSQLASTARRLSAEQALPLVRNLLSRREDAADPHLPLLLWWAVEDKAESDRTAVLELFEDSSFWRLPLVDQTIVGRLMRRYAAAGGHSNLLACARLLDMAPDVASSSRLMQGFEEAFEGRALPPLPDPLASAMAHAGGDSLVIGIRQRREDAITDALAVVTDEKAEPRRRRQLVKLFGEVHAPQTVSTLLAIALEPSDDELRMAALSSLRKYDEPRIAEAIIDAYATYSADALAVAHSLLVSRRTWSGMLLVAIEVGKIDPKSVPPDVVRRLSIHRDDRIAQRVARHWGPLPGATTAEMQQEIARLEEVVNAATGSPYQGQQLFREACAKCHTLFGKGGQIGPDLTAYRRDDLANMLLAVVNPNAEIREGFETSLVLTEDGLALTGLIVDRNPTTVTLRGVDGQSITLARDQIDQLQVQKTSLMPTGLLKHLSEQQVRDLLAYLRSSQPLNN